MKKDKHGNVMLIEKLWALLPHWLARRIGFLFPAKKVIVDPHDDKW